MERFFNSLHIRNLMSGLIDFLGGKEQTEVFITLVIALAAIGAFIFNGIHVVRASQAMRMTKGIEKTKYMLDRTALSKQLLQEINENELALMQLFYFVGPDKKTIIRGENINNLFKTNSKYHNLFNSFKKVIFDKFLDSNVDFRNIELTLDIKNFYSDIESIKETLTFFIELEGKKDLKNKRVFLLAKLNELIKMRHVITKNINILYNNFSREIEYNYRKGKFYVKFEKPV